MGKKNSVGSVAAAFKRLFITAAFCQTPSSGATGGFKPMPNSFTAPDAEKWPILESRRTDGRQSETPECVRAARKAEPTAAWSFGFISFPDWR